jgi:prophage regulatory protein
MPDATPSPRFLRRADVCQRVGLSRSHLAALEAQGRFPARVKLTERASAWLESEVSDWMASRVAARVAKGAA